MSPDMTPAKLDEIEREARETAEAAPGPWCATKYQVVNAAGPVTAYDRGDSEAGPAYDHIANCDPQTILALIAEARQAATLRENGPPMQRGTKGDGSPWMGTMRDVLEDYRAAAATEAHERKRAMSEAAHYCALIEAHNAKLSRYCQRQDLFCRGAEPGDCIACPRRIYGIDLPKTGEDGK